MNATQLAIKKTLCKELTLHKKYLPSPLRYPGGKSKAIKTLLNYIPKSVTTLCSPFFGGGSIELACLAKGIKVYGYDIFEPLTNFWQQLLINNQVLAKHVETYFPLEKTAFYHLQKNYFELKDPIQQAAAYYVLNRCSFSGTTLSGGMSPGHPRFSQSSINRLRNFKVKNLSVDKKDFTQTLQLHKKHFLYLDPPYANGGALYGKKGSTHKDFPHRLLAELLLKRGNWIMSYNDCELIRKLYKGLKFDKLTWNYGMNSSKKSNEVLILSHDLAI